MSPLWGQVEEATRTAFPSCTLVLNATHAGAKIPISQSFLGTLYVVL